MTVGPAAMTAALSTQESGWRIRHDPTIVQSPGASLFDAGWHREAGRLLGSARGRGQVHFIKGDVGDWALRHYRRGGLVGRFITDRYLYVGESRVRSFAEFRITGRLHAQGLPVPRPVAAAYCRRGPWYTADLITVMLPDCRTLTERLNAAELDDRELAAVGQCVRRFHDAGLDHADLNAHNILIDGQAKVWLIDFDRARYADGGRWRGANLSRLRRSLEKVSDPGSAHRAWQGIILGYESDRA